MKQVEAEEYDVVIIGSGMGGLACANILGQEGKKVIVLEKNHQIGGNLQVFSRNKSLFDTGVHYLGGLDKGQNFYKLLKYFGIMDDLKLYRMDEDGFDYVYFYDEKEPYKIRMGYENFIDSLVQRFPEEEEAILKFCELIKEYCSKFPLYHLSPEPPEYTLGDSLTINAKELIDSLTDNKRLAKVLAGSNALIAGSLETPFYVWALVLNSYIESSWKCVDGGSQIAIQMQRSIRKFGGKILKRAEVIGVNYDKEEARITSVILEDGRTIKGGTFISNIPPQQTIRLVGEDKFRKAYCKRILSLKNTTSCFTLHVSFKKNTFPYFNYNVYQIGSDELWEGYSKFDESWPDKYMLSTPANSKSREFADAASIMCYMDFSNVEQWKDSHNTIANKGERPESYMQFKEECCQKIIDRVCERYPNFRDSIEAYYSSTPLTFRDYIGNDDGTLYGIMKNSEDGIKTYINPKTKVSNLLLTGANLNLHGLLGVSISAIVTCSELVSKNKIIEAIEAAQ